MSRRLGGGDDRRRRHSGIRLPPAPDTAGPHHRTPAHPWGTAQALPAVWAALRTLPLECLPPSGVGPGPIAVRLIQSGTNVTFGVGRGDSYGLVARVCGPEVALADIKAEVSAAR